MTRYLVTYEDGEAELVTETVTAESEEEAADAITEEGEYRRIVGIEEEE
jgi:hypothetical protein